MSQANVEMVKRGIEAFNRRDIDAVDDLITRDFEFITAMAGIENEIIRGREGVEKYFESLDDAWEEFLLVPGEFRDLGDRVVMLGRLEGRGKRAWASMPDSSRSTTSATACPPGTRSGPLAQKCVLRASSN